LAFVPITPLPWAFPAAALPDECWHKPNDIASNIIALAVPSDPMSTKRKPEKQESATSKPVGREPKSGYGNAREVRLVLMLTPDEDAAYRRHCEREGCSRQTPARQAMAARLPFISKD
jgi:hypothetical protein